MASHRSDPGSGLVIVGRIAAPYGIKGWVRIHSYTDPPGNMVDYGPWLLRQQHEWREVELDAIETRGTALLVRFAGCATRDDAALLGGQEIAVAESRLPALAEGEYYWRQLLGLAVYDARGRRFGTVERLMATGANDVLVVRGDSGSIDQRERLIPFLQDQVILGVDLERGEIRVEWDAEF